VALSEGECEAKHLHIISRFPLSIHLCTKPEREALLVDLNPRLPRDAKRKNMTAYSSCTVKLVCLATSGAPRRIRVGIRVTRSIGPDQVASHLGWSRRRDECPSWGNAAS
jgi:hypothetical protein